MPQAAGRGRRPSQRPAGAPARSWSADVATPIPRHAPRVVRHRVAARGRSRGTCRGCQATSPLGPPRSHSGFLLEAGRAGPRRAVSCRARSRRIRRTQWPEGRPPRRLAPSSLRCGKGGRPPEPSRQPPSRWEARLAGPGGRMRGRRGPQSRGSSGGNGAGWGGGDEPGAVEAAGSGWFGAEVPGRAVSIARPGDDGPGGAGRGGARRPSLSSAPAPTGAGRVRGPWTGRAGPGLGATLSAKVRHRAARRRLDSPSWRSVKLRSTKM